MDLAPLELRFGHRHALQADLHAVDLAVAVDDLAEGVALEVDVALGPEVVVRILDPPDGQARAFEAHRLVGADPDGLVGLAVADLDAPLEQGRREAPALAAGRDVELRAQHPHVAGVGLHDERMVGIVRHVETGFAVDPHAALGRSEERRVFEPGPGIEPHGRAVRERNLQVLTRRDVEGDVPGPEAFERPALAVVVAPEEERHRRRGRKSRHSPAAHQVAEVVFAVAVVEFVDERGAQGRQVVTAVDLGEQAFVFRIGFQPVEDLPFLLRGGLAGDVAI